MNIRELQLKYPAAAYAFFRVTNAQTACAVFLKSGGTILPRFRYSKYLSNRFIRDRKLQLESDMKSVQVANDAETFLRRRQKENNLLENFVALRELPATSLTKENINNYQEIQRQLYGPLDGALFNGIISRLESMAKNSSDARRKTRMSEITKMVKKTGNGRLYLPGPDTFIHYKSLWYEIDGDLHQLLDNIHIHRKYSPREITALIRDGLDIIGAKRRGWTANLKGRGTKVAVSRYGKRVIVNQDISPKTSLRLKQIIAHELGAHVRRVMALESKLPTRPRSDEEGLGLLLEQLLAKRFMYKRTMRYLAIGLGYGLDGKPRDFKETYEILWRAMVVMGGDEKTAHERAFYETVRAFRGGLPEVAGMVYIKDKVYLESNIALWQFLGRKLLNQQEFEQLLDGRDTMRVEDIQT